MMEPHAVVSTGAKKVKLAGGRSRRTAKGVPVLELSNEHYEVVVGAVERLHDPEQENEYLVGVRAYLHTATDRAGEPRLATLVIGGETLDEAAKTCVGYFEDHVSEVGPDWVASTDDRLAGVLADHYGCAVRGMDEELAP